MQSDEKTKLNWHKHGRQIEALYHQYRGLLFAVANQVLGQPAAAEDIVHNAMLRIAQIYDRIDQSDPHRVKGLLVTITRHLSIDHMRRHHRELPYHPEALGMLAQGHALPADQSMERSQYHGTIIRYINSLGPRYETAFILKYVYDLPDSSIARILGVSAGALRVQLTRARKQLRKIIENEPDQEQTRLDIP